MPKIKLCTVSDDRAKRKGGKYQATQQKIQALLDGFIEQFHYNIAELPPFSPLLENTDAAKNGRVYKSWVVLDQLNQLNNGDYLIYNDCSPELWQGVQSLDCYDLDVIKGLCDRSGGILVGFVKWDDKIIGPGELGRHTHRHFTLDNLLYSFIDGEHIDSYQCASGMICMRKCQRTMDIIEQWLRICCIEEFSCMNVDETEDDYYSGKPGSKCGNRHDQSILSLLLNTCNVAYCDIVYNELNPYNFLNFCLPGHDYKFINSNTGEPVIL